MCDKNEKDSYAEVYLVFPKVLKFLKIILPLILLMYFTGCFSFLVDFSLTLGMLFPLWLPNEKAEKWIICLRK